MARPAPTPTVTHWTDEDFTARVKVLRAACGKTVGHTEVTYHGEPPSCPTCRTAYDEFQRMEVA